MALPVPSTIRRAGNSKQKVRRIQHFFGGSVVRSVMCVIDCTVSVGIVKQPPNSSRPKLGRFETRRGSVGGSPPPPTWAGRLTRPVAEPIRHLHDCWDSYSAGTTFAGAGLAPAGSTHLYAAHVDHYTTLPFTRRLHSGVGCLFVQRQKHGVPCIDAENAFGFVICRL